MRDEVDKLPPEIVDAIDEFCRRLAGSAGPADLSRELATHMEEKCLRYLNGDEAITAEDAFLLAREHFGRPDIVREMLRDVHSPHPAGPPARRAARFVLALVAAAGTAAAVWVPMAVLRLPLAFAYVPRIVSLRDGPWPGAHLWAALVALAWLAALLAPGRGARRLALAFGAFFCLAATHWLAAIVWAGGMEQPGEMSAVRWLWHAPATLLLAGLCGLGAALLAPRRAPDRGWRWREAVDSGLR